MVPNRAKHYIFFPSWLFILNFFRYSDFQRTSNEKEVILSKIKGAANEMDAKMRQEVKKVVKQNEELELALKRALWEKEDILKEKQFEIQRLVK